MTAIRPATLNTAGGDWESAARINRDIHQLWADLMPYTEIEIAIETFLGSRPESTADVSESTERVVITVIGGQVGFVVSPAQARGIGLKVQPPEPEGSLEGLTPPATEFPEQDLKVLLQLEHGIDLRVGDRVVAFLRADSISLATGGAKTVLLSVIPEGAGLFRISGDPASFVNAGTGDSWSSEEVLNQAEALKRAPGPAERLFDG